MAGCHREEEDPARSLGEFQLTYYWVATPEEADLSTPPYRMLDLEGNLIATVPEDLARILVREGSGLLPDGRLVNVASAELFGPASRFVLVDREAAPWGLDSQGDPLVPFRTVAVDPQVVPLGTELYLPALDGLRLPDGSAHDGRVQARDVGTGVLGHHVDLFAGTREQYRAADLALGERETVEIRLAPSRDR